MNWIKGKSYKTASASIAVYLGEGLDEVKPHVFALYHSDGMVLGAIAQSGEGYVTGEQLGKGVFDE